MSQPPSSNGINLPGESDPSFVAPTTHDAPDLKAIYANFVRVSGTPEEMLLDFGLNSQGAGTAANPIQISNRIAMNYYTAKRLWLTMGASLQRHEQMFGALEIDVSKRVLPSARSAAPR
jgi:hypothetical protein